MSSGDREDGGADEREASDAEPPADAPTGDGRGHEGAPEAPIDAPVESAPADEALGATPSAADRDPMPAAGAPAELTSDDDRPGQSPDAAAEVAKPRPRRDGLAPGEHEAKGGALTTTAAATPAEAPAVTTTSSAAASDVPVVEEATAGERTAPEGGDTAREGVEAPATTVGGEPDATAPGQPEATAPPAPVEVADERPTDAVTAEGEAVPDDSSALAVTTTDVGDEIAAGETPQATPDVAPVAGGDAEVPSLDVHPEPSETDAPGDVAPPSGDAAATNPPVDAPTDLPAPGADAGAPADGAPVDSASDAPVAEAPVADAPADAEPAATDAPPVAEPDAPADAAVEPDAPVEPDAAVEPEVVEVDELRQPLLDLLAEHLGDDLVATHVAPGRDVTARVTRDAWVKAGEVCRDVLGLRSFSFLSAMDWMPSPYGRSEDGGLAGAGDDAAVAPADTSRFDPGTTGGDTRFQLLARLEAPVAPSLGITLKCDLPADDLVAPTWTKVFPGADWHERECAEMFGIDFAGHPNLVKLYLPGEFEGFPLRKDFPLLARDVKPWPGLVDVEAMPGEEATEDDESVTAGAEEG